MHFEIAGRGRWVYCMDPHREQTDVRLSDMADLNI